jgi:uncharacterized Zn finger protein (UPF0148 family)
MAALFGPSASDLEHLRSTVRALGTTSVPGLSAALSWRERKTEKLLAHELARPNSPIVYDPARRTVRWAVPALEIPAPPPPTPATISAPRSFGTPYAPAPVYTPAGLKTLCPHCQVALQSTGSAGLVVCPGCGRLSSARSGAVSSSAPVAAPPPPPAAVIPGPTAMVSGTDRKSQELFAAWVTNQPIPCPKCRTPLRHRGIREYGCPSCGQQIRFPEPATDAARAVPPEPLPAR